LECIAVRYSLLFVALPTPSVLYGAGSLAERPGSLQWLDKVPYPCTFFVQAVSLEMHTPGRVMMSWDDVMLGKGAAVEELLMWILC
jgi:hypothetical protein